MTVSFRGNKPYSYENEYTGDVDIPETVTYSGKTYTVTSISYEAFSGCSGMTSITISNSVTNIGSYVFYGCSGLTSVTIPGSVTSIGPYAFYGCTALTTFKIRATVPPLCVWSTLDDINNETCTLYVPSKKIAVYKKTDY